MKQIRIVLAVSVAFLLFAFCGHQLWFRVVAESNDRNCATAMEAEVLEQMGNGGEAWMESAGIDYIIRDGCGYDRAGNPVFSMQAGNDRSLPLALIENHTRTGVNVQEIPDVPMVKALYLYDDYADRMVGNDFSEIEDLLFRAAVDRGMRLLILTPFSDGEGAVCTEPAVYAACLSNLEERLEARGLTLHGGFSCMELDERADSLVPVMVQKLLMLAAAIVMPCGCGVIIADMAGSAINRRKTVRFLLAFFALTIAGGATVSALMTDSRYLLCFDVFSGVKLALLVPVAVSGGLLLMTLWKELFAGNGCKNIVALFLCFILACGVFFLLTARSGDFSGWTSKMETVLRTWLERTLYVRPRTKEFLFAAPCIPIFLWACWKEKEKLKLVSGLGVALECVSVVNTFCHGVAQLRISVARSLLGLGIGVAIGLLICVFLTQFDRIYENMKKNKM